MQKCRIISCPSIHAYLAICMHGHEQTAGFHTNDVPAYYQEFIMLYSYNELLIDITMQAMHAINPCVAISQLLTSAGHATTNIDESTIDTSLSTKSNQLSSLSESLMSVSQPALMSTPLLTSINQHLH